MSLAVSPPARYDLSMRDNDDTLVALMWRATDGVTPVAIASAHMTLLFDTGEPEPPAARFTISSTTPGNAGGWFEADRFAEGLALAHVPHGMWTTVPFRSGVWDLIAISVEDTITRCLARGEFIVEQGVSA